MYLTASSSIADEYPELIGDISAIDSFLKDRGHNGFRLGRAADHTDIYPRRLERILELYSIRGAVELRKVLVCPLHSEELTKNENDRWYCDLCDNDGYELDECEIAAIYYLNEAAEIAPQAMSRDATRMSSDSERRAKISPIARRLALVVGINEYNDFPKLNFCVNDANALAKLLAQHGYEVVTLHDEVKDQERRKPTKFNIEAELKAISEAAELNDLLVVYFACHGKLLENEPVLIACDTRVQLLGEQSLKVKAVKERMDHSVTGRKVLILDACHSGISDGRGLDDLEFIRNVNELAFGFAILAGSTSQQKAQEWNEQKHGVFTYYLLKGLAGEACQNQRQFVTVQDIMEYTLDQLSRWQVREGGHIQKPTFQVEGVGDMILVDLSAKTAP